MVAMLSLQSSLLLDHTVPVKKILSIALAMESLCSLLLHNLRRSPSLRRDLNEGCIGFYNNVREFFDCVDLVKKRINVVILNEVAAPGIDKVN